MDLFECLVSWENLIAAARLARKGKPRSRGLCAFEAAREQSLVDLREELRAGTYQPAPLRTFEMYDPKPRLISAAPYRDRVVHHALVQVLEPLWERSFIHHSYACRRGKGTHRALEACSRFARRYEWVLRADVRKFYPSVDHEVLLGLLRKRVRDVRVLRLAERILAIGDGESPPLTYFPGDDLFSPAERPRGLPIGNLTSQFFANVYLDAVDHRMTDDLGFGAYVRYMDDVFVFGDSRERVLAARGALQECLESLRLRLHPGKRNVMPCTEGIPFLGFRVFPDHRRLRTTGKVRQARRLRTLVGWFSEGKCDIETVRSSVMSMRGHVCWANSYYLLRARAREVVFSRSGSVGR